MFPDNDNQFEEQILTKVEANGTGNGWEIFYGSMGFWCPPESPVTPEVGMTARFYGRGFGSRVRGLFIDGHKVFYRTEAEDSEHHEVQMYGADAAEWLKRWDEGRTVWTIEMGGLGPGYEQCIHIACAEILREILNGGYDQAWKWYDEADHDGRKAQWKIDRERIESRVFKVPVIEKLGLSGAQWGAAMNLATLIHRRGPRWIMNDEAVKDRHIQVQKSFPAAA